MTAAIALEDVSVRLDGRAVLERLSLRLMPAERVVVVGASGCGKTTLLRVVLGLLPPQAGRIHLHGELASAPRRILKPPEARELAVVFQDLALWPHRTVYGNLEFGLRARGRSRTEARRQIREMLARVELTERARSYPRELSGGERQRVAIARALVTEPQAILMDEPLTHVDPVLGYELRRMFTELLRERAPTVLYVTHDPAEAAELDADIAVLEDGCIAERGTLATLRETPRSRFMRALVDREALSSRA